MTMKFNANELNKEFFLTRAKEEATQIYSKENTRKNRSFQEILEITLYGHAPEVYLIENHSFKDDHRKYKDVIDPNGNHVEVKTTEGDYYVPFVLKRANAAKLETWRKFPDILYIFIGDKQTGDYELHDIYEWNGKTFSVQNK
jgi:hypothetical protein